MTDVILADAEAERQRGLLLGLQVALDGVAFRRFWPGIIIWGCRLSMCR